MAKAAFGVRLPGYPPYIMNFTITHAHLCSITIHKSGNTYRDKENPTEDDLVKILQGKGYWSSTSTADHPEFNALRERLGAEGYIRIQRNSWNGDRVLKEFYVNGARFKPGEKFACGAAIKYDIECKLKTKNKHYSY